MTTGVRGRRDVALRLAGRARVRRERGRAAPPPRHPRRPTTTALIDLAVQRLPRAQPATRASPRPRPRRRALWGARLDRLAAGDGHHASCTPTSRPRSPPSSARTAALVFSSGYLANLGAVPRSPGRGLARGLGRAQPRVAHRRLPALPRRGRRGRRTATSQRSQAALADRAEQRALVVTDAVFSVDGEAAPLAALHDGGPRSTARPCSSTRRTRSAWSARVAAGLAAVTGLADEPDVVLTVTLSKALGSQGGVVLGPRQRWSSHLVDAARPSSSTRPSAPPLAAAALAALEAAGKPNPAAPRRRAPRGRPAPAVAVDGRAALGAPPTPPWWPSAAAPEAALLAAAVLRRAHGVRSAASGRRRCPTASRGCASPHAPTSPPPT